MGAGCADKSEVQAAYEYRIGVAVAIHLPQGRHFMSALIVTLPCQGTHTRQAHGG
jgi:hypothetical protein